MILKTGGSQTKMGQNSGKNIPIGSGHQISGNHIPIGSSQQISGNLGSQNSIPKTLSDNYETMQQLTQALRRAGLEKANLLIAIDFTKSNIWQGKETFEGKCLHDVAICEGEYTGSGVLNPYEYVLTVAGEQIEEFDDDKIFPTCIFGHRSAEGQYLKPLKVNGKDPQGVSEVLQAYRQAVSENALSGGTMFEPIINWAMKYARDGEYHILVIIGDGCIEDKIATKKALARAGSVPLSVIFVGVGDGSDPENKEDKWATMRDLDDNPSGDLDNWQSVYLTHLSKNSENPGVNLARNMFMEIPEQFAYFKRKGMIGKKENEN